MVLCIPLLQRSVLQIRSYFFSETFKARIHFSRSVQCRFDMRENILCAKMANEFCLLHHPGRLLARRSMRSVRPVFRSRSEKTCSAWRPVASIAVMLRARSTTTADNFLRYFVSSATLSVVPNKNDP
jgi:hypothetical protein